MHEKLLPAVGRHADDLLVFLLDIVATISSRQWLPSALCFLKAYGEADVIAALKKQLALTGRSRLDLVGGTNEFHKTVKSETTLGKSWLRDWEFGALSSGNPASAVQMAPFNYLPRVLTAQGSQRAHDRFGLDVRCFAWLIALRSAKECKSGAVRRHF